MNVTRTVLSNGLTVLLHHDPHSDVVAIVTYVRAGYFDEPDDVVGIAHVVEHMFFKGTPRYGVGEIARATKGAGGYLNAHTIYDHTSYYTVLPASAFATGCTSRRSRLLQGSSAGLMVTDKAWGIRAVSS